MSSLTFSSAVCTPTEITLCDYIIDNNVMLCVKAALSLSFTPSFYYLMLFQEDPYLCGCNCCFQFYMGQQSWWLLLAFQVKYEDHLSLPAIKTYR